MNSPNACHVRISSSPMDGFTTARRRAGRYLAHRVEFRSNHRLRRLFALDTPGSAPPDERWTDCIEGIRFTAASTGDFMLHDLWEDGYYQDDVLVALRSLLKPSDVFWDLGANDGFMTLYVNAVFAGQVATRVFEPSPIDKRDRSALTVQSDHAAALIIRR